MYAIAFPDAATRSLANTPDDASVVITVAPYVSASRTASERNAVATGTTKAVPQNAVTVIERRIETERIVAAAGGISEEYLNARLAKLEQDLRGSLTASPGGGSSGYTTINNNYQLIAQSNNIDRLGAVTIEDSTITGGTISGSAVSDVTITGSSFAGSVSATTLSASGTSTLATTTISGDLTVSGNTTVSGTLTIPGAISISSSTIGLLTNTYATTSFISAVTASTTNLTWVNATGTNATTTNFFSTNASTTNSTSTNLYASSFVAGNATTTNLFTSQLTASALTIGSLNAISTIATSTFAGGALFTRAPSLAHTFSAWAVGAADSAWHDATLVINPASAVADSNLISASVNGSPRFIVDAEGDVFVNNLTSVGSVTLSTTTASTFTVEGNTTFGDAISDVSTVNGTLTVTGTTTVGTVTGNFGVGTSTPWGRISISAVDNGSIPQLVVASSSAISLIVDNRGYVGIGTSSPAAKLSVDAPIYVGGTGVTATSTIEGNLHVWGLLKVGTSSSYISESNISTIGDLTATNATTTSFYSTTASSTNLYASNAQFGALTLLGTLSTVGLATFQNGFVSQASSTVAGAFTATGNTKIGGTLGIGTSSNDASAVVQIDSTTQGFLPPRMTTAQKSAIGSAAAGLTVYDSTLNKLNVFNGTSWKNVGSTEINGEVTNGTQGSVLFIGDGGVLGQDNTGFSYATSSNRLLVVQASSTRLSVFNTAYFGGSATTTIDSAGNVQVAGGLGVGAANTTAGTIKATAANTTGTIQALSGASNAYAAFSIGRTASDGFLAVAGTVNNWTSGSVAGDVVLTSNGGGKLSLSARPIANVANITLDTAGNVGIGTTSPWKMLSVAGDIIGTNITATGTLAVAGATTLSSTLDVTGNTTLANATTTNLFSTTASSTNLFASVAQFGSLSVLGALTQTGLGTLTNGFVSQASSTVVGAFTNTGAATFGSTLAASGLATLSSGFVSQASSTVAGAFTTTGTNTFGGVLNIAGAITSTATSANTFPYASTTALTTTNLFVNATSTFGATLGVKNDFYGTGGQWQQGIQNYSGTNVMEFGVNGSSDAFTFGYGTPGSLTRALTIQGSGNVGIGTTTPNSKLTIAGANIAVTNDGGILKVNSTDSGAVDVGGMLSLGGRYDSDEGAVLSFGQIAGRKENSTAGNWSGYLQFNTRQYGGAIAERMRITSSGSVGIGSTTPSAKLVVSGDMFLDGSSRYINFGTEAQGTNGYGFRDNAGTLQIKNSGGSWTDIPTSASGASGSTGQFPYFSATDTLTGTSTLYLATTGNIGIGTTSPWAKLSVSAADNASAPQFLVASSSAVSLMVASTGNVGIGNISPSYKLDVTGFVNVDGTAGGYKIAGNNALYASSTNNGVVVGPSSGASIFTTVGATHNSIIGSGSMNGSTVTGDRNNVLGASAMTALTSGSKNQAIGVGAFTSLTEGWDNIAIGDDAGYYNATGNANVYIGQSSGRGTSGQSQSSNSAVGYRSLYTVSTGGTNSVLGYQAGYTITTGSNNVILGYNGTSGGITSGSNNIVIGQDVRSGLTATASNQLNIGNLIFGTSIGSGTTLGTGNIGVGTSTPLRKLAVENAAAAAQFAVAYDTTRVTEIQTDSSGDVVINPSGDDVRINDDNLWVCAGGSCPTGAPSGTGNLVIESNLGIGTSTPKSMINTSASNALNVFSAAGAGVPVIALHDGDSAQESAIATNGAGLFIDVSGHGTATNNNIIFRTNNTNGTYAATERLRITSAGYVGIGTTTPTDMLSVQGLLRVGANSNSSVTMGTATSTFNGDIKIIGKLDVNTIDPPYTIDGIKYATYVPSMTGVKEETAQVIYLNEKDANGKYAYTIDFSAQRQGSDLWLFYQTTDLGAQWQYLTVLLTPAFDGRVHYQKVPGENKLVIYADQPGEVSMRLTGNRYDFTKWPNLRPDQDGDTRGTHVISSGTKFEE